jgi:glycosyltransferase involved in cell wall biosynthesis
MRILITTDTLDGSWRHAVELTRALRDRRHRVALATLGAPLTAAQRAEVRQMPDVPVYESAFRLPWMPDPWSDFAPAGVWLRAIERSFRAEVVCLNHEGHGAMPWRAAVVSVVHSCVLSWWEAVKGESAPASWNRYRAQVATGLGGSDEVVAPSEWLLRQARRLYGFQAPGRAIPNARREADFVVEEKRPFVLAAGRLWDEGVNAECLARAARGLPWPVYAAGETRRPDGLGFAGQGLRILGALPPGQLREWYSRAAVFAHPALYEPSGLAPLEAALSGCALVLADIESLRETWGDAAVYVPPRDAEGLARALRELLTNEPRRSSLATLARERARRLTPDTMADAYVDAFTAAAARRPNAGVRRRLPMARSA